MILICHDRRTRVPKGYQWMTFMNSHQIIISTKQYFQCIFIRHYTYLRTLTVCLSVGIKYGFRFNVKIFKITQAPEEIKIFEIETISVAYKQFERVQSVWIFYKFLNFLTLFYKLILNVFNRVKLTFAPFYHFSSYLTEIWLSWNVSLSCLNIKSKPFAKEKASLILGLFLLVQTCFFLFLITLFYVK